MNSTSLYLIHELFLLCRFCRILYDFVEKNGCDSFYNAYMDLSGSYVPREYLSLKINYCRQQLSVLPVVKLQRKNKEDDSILRVCVGAHKYSTNSDDGRKYLSLMHQRESVEQELQLYRAIWSCYFKGEPSSDCVPITANRTIWVDTNKPVFLNKTYFDSLKNDANTKYPKPKIYKFNGIFYRSAAEREIAVFYTEMGIPFKYEPEVMIKGLVRPIYPDFVAYFKEIDNCKFHEHFGMSDYADYLKSGKIKFSNFADAGLLQDLDLLFTHSNDDSLFDPRHLCAKLNSAIYGTICLCKTDIQSIKPFQADAG